MQWRCNFYKGSGRQVGVPAAPAWVGGQMRGWLGEQLDGMPSRLASCSAGGEQQAAGDSRRRP